MSNERELVVNTGIFTEVLEAKIEAGEGVFEDTYPFLRTAMRGLASRLGEREIVPLGFVNATELYIFDVNTGVNGFTREPMPQDVTGMPFPMAGEMIRMTASMLVRDAFGDEFADAVQQTYDSL